MPDTVVVCMETFMRVFMIKVVTNTGTDARNVGRRTERITTSVYRKPRPRVGVVCK